MSRPDGALLTVRCGGDAGRCRRQVGSVTRDERGQLMFTPNTRDAIAAPLPAPGVAVECRCRRCGAVGTVDAADLANRGEILSRVGGG